jgi:polyisoprenoid-binding protein YceI
MKNAVAALVLSCACSAVAATPAKYIIDSSHTYPSFETDHTGLSFWRGKVNHTQGTVVLDREARTGTVDIVMDMTTIDFGYDPMNKRAMDEDMLNTAQYPQATYQGTIAFDGDKPHEVNGQLTLRGVTRPVKLEIRMFGCAPHPVTKKMTCGADAQASFRRDDFGIEIGKGGGSKPEVRLAISIEARLAE